MKNDKIICHVCAFKMESKEVKDKIVNVVEQI